MNHSDPKVEPEATNQVKNTNKLKSLVVGIQKTPPNAHLYDNTDELLDCESYQDVLLCWFGVQGEFLVTVGGGDDHSESLSSHKTTR